MSLQACLTRKLEPRSKISPKQVPAWKSSFFSPIFLQNTQSFFLMARRSDCVSCLEAFSTSSVLTEKWWTNTHGSNQGRFSTATNHRSNSVKLIESPVHVSNFSPLEDSCSYILIFIFQLYRFLFKRIFSRPSFKGYPRPCHDTNLHFSGYKATPSVS